MDDFRLDEQLPTELDRVTPFVERVCASLSRSLRSEQTLFKVKLALEEALTNAMRHGNSLDPARKVDVSLRVADNRLVMDVRDEGAGFDPSAVPDPTTTQSASLPGGRGLYLMRSLMDSVDFYDKGRAVSMTLAIRE